ncbi:6-aminohexanoate hydrolase [Pelagivirga sediminicola]|uniref:6-aminohexanoate hydrolase n=1 Tax=Pelagivirga sediminicola TaxID=2170575 RepID=A0A2T7G8C0_9RHOB|nr:serine hydrolase [Pelagivirga sediminicola]PVA10675.1 6-aminohexanoate hydrolase [Pelagivirga sediminicola]
MKRVIATALFAALGCSSAAFAEGTDAPSSEQAPGDAAQTDTGVTDGESDTAGQGWMQGFPPPADKVIRATDPDFFADPKRRWTMCHFRQLMPNVAVDAGASAASPLTSALDSSLDDVTFTPLGGGEPMTWNAAFDANHTDGVIVLHHGRVVYERYDGCLDENGLHGAMSVTKSLTGLLAEILIAESRLDQTARVGDLIPELNDSGFGDATVREVMDMTTALKFSEDYSDPNAEIWTYSEAGSTLPKPEGYDGPRSYFDYLQTVRKNGTHGEVFGYRTVNSDALGWIISRVTGQSVADYLADRIWSRLGAEREAFYTVDSIGTPFAGGGFNATLRDMARLGQVMLNGGRAGNEQIVPERVVNSIMRGGDKGAFAEAGYKTLPGWSYRSMWWVAGDSSYAARGVHGQTLWIDPKTDVVIARFASHPVAPNAANDPTSLPAYRAVADHLQENDDMPLVGREWLIEDVEGMGVIDYSHATLQFMADGTLAGSATCNRLIGRYEVEGDALTILPAGATMMACPEALMAQERRILDLLPKIERYVIDETGALILIAPDGRAIAARR